MRGTVQALAVALAALACPAFDSAAWLKARNDDSDMLRLRYAYAECVARLENPARNVKIPLETHADGTVKSRLAAERAQLFLDTGLVWAEAVRVEQYDRAGAVIATLEADACVVDRKTKTGWVEGEARIEMSGTRVSGRGVHFDATAERVKIYSQTKIRTKSKTFNMRKFL